MARAPTAKQDDLFAAEPALPEGFEYRENVLTEPQERDLAARLETLPFAPFEFHGFLGKRRIVSYGYRYEYSGRGALRESAEIPEFLLPLRERAAAFAGVEARCLQQALVTEYAPGAGIGWHRDKPMFEDVVAVSLLSPCCLRFRRKQGAEWERRTLTVKPRSAYLLRGPSRREWEHSVPPVEALRYSVTFRNFTGQS
jgi:alkylated DNA repair dioxygenase AlkB